MLRRENRPALAFQRFHRGIVVDGDDEHVGFLRGCLEVTYVADVQQVEAAVRERDRPARGPIGRDEPRELLEGDDAAAILCWHVRSLRPQRFRRTLRSGFSLRIASRSSRAETVAVPRFMTTRPPA